MNTVVDDQPNAMMSAVDPAERAESLEPGMRVEVRRRFDQHWARGFELVAVTESGYRVRRLSDGMELPADFADEDVRRERKRQGMWWY
ncbi:MAG: hypothetical protein JO050_03395 [Acidimicrobiia bacterium]|nr:hypothetical protein [Acidimicrobiia bacterium]